MSRAEGKKHTKLKAIQIECKSALARAVGAALGIASGRSVGATLIFRRQINAGGQGISPTISHVQIQNWIQK